MTSAPRISAVICTHNRAHALERAVDSLFQQTLPRGSFEIVVVDNGSTDATPRVVDGIRASCPAVRYTREERLGLSIARNTGIQVAAGEIVAFLDDDARAESDWLGNLLRAFDGACPSPAAVGGRVVLDWGGCPPSWLPPSLWSVYTHLDHGPVCHALREGEHLVGANLAFRRECLVEIGGFNRALGRAGTRLASGEEADVLKRLQAAGYTLYYTPHAVVHHPVPAERQTGRWLRSRMFWDGASQPLLDYGVGRSRAFYARRARYDSGQVALLALRWARSLPTAPHQVRLHRALATIQRAGRLRTEVALAFRPAYRTARPDRRP